MLASGAIPCVAQDEHQSVLFEGLSSKEVVVAFTGPMKRSEGGLTLLAKLPWNGGHTSSLTSWLRNLRSALALGRAWLFRQLSK